MGNLLTFRDVTRWSPLEILVDAEFENLGFLGDRLPRMLVFAEDCRALRQALLHECVAAVIAPPDLARELPSASRAGIAIVPNPRLVFARLHNALVEQTDFYGVRQPSEIDPSARIHPRAAIAGDDVRIGPGVVVEANAIIGPGCTLGRGVVVRAGAVLGSAGFKTCKDKDGHFEMIHAGALLVEEGAQIFSNATIARGLFRQATRIGREARIGNNAFVSHNVEVGARTFVGHGAVVSGNVRIGREVWVGPGAVLSNRVSIGDGSRVSLGAVVIGDVSAGAHVSGNFAVEHRRLLRHVAGLS